MLRRFYFDVGNGQETIRDDEGVEAEDLEQALSDARTVISEMADELGATGIGNSWTLERGPISLKHKRRPRSRQL